VRNNASEFTKQEPSRKRKQRTSFSYPALEALTAYFEKNMRPTGMEITRLAQQLGYNREVIRIWFCNKRQASKKQ
jgi:class 6 POU domain transcription factor